MFNQLGNYNLEYQQFGGGGPGTVLVIRHPAAADKWAKIENSGVLVVGGAKAKKELNRVWQGNNRAGVQSLMPISSGVHTKIKQWLEANR